MIIEFESQLRKNIKNLGSEPALREESLDWMTSAGKTGNDTCKFRWLGRPLRLLPQDMATMRQVI